MIIERLQHLFTRLYDLPTVPDIAAYLITTGPAPRYERIAGNRFPKREAVFVKECDDALELGLYLHPQILKRLEASGQQWPIDDLSCAAEGVSHFLYLSDRYQHGRSCSLLELELQAEVDKFLALHLLTLESTGTIPPDLFARQFNSPDYDAELSADEIERYQTASHFAAKFCRALRDRSFFPYRPHTLVAAAKPFFHRDLQGKLERLLP